jgi:nitrite reductase/ring-hydroxylating ferredoxin subunit
MEKQEQIRVIRGLMDHLDNGTNVDAGGQVHNPVSSYTSFEVGTKEWQTFFQDYPQVMGLSPDLPENGSFFTSKDIGKPILCTRDHDGRFHAFLNVCRHRGTVVENDPRGKKNVFSCPFHAWSYSPKGDLVSVPREDHFGPVDKSCHGLVELPAEEKHGILFVHPNPEGTMDLDDLLGDLGPELAAWDIGKNTYLDNTTFNHKMNWKLAIDTFGETYHFEVLHKDTLAENLYGNVQMYDTYKRNHRMALCLRNIDNLRAQPEEDWHVLHAAVPVYYLFPNVQLIFGGGGPTLVRVYPRGENPNDSYSEVSFYLDPVIEKMRDVPEFAEQYKEIENRVRNFGDIIDKEDYVAAASSHLGALSGAQAHITFGRNEPALHHYHNTYREALDMPPLERISN